MSDITFLFGEGSGVNKTNSLKSEPESVVPFVRAATRCVHVQGLPMSLSVCPPQPQESLSSLKSISDQAALSSGIEGDVASLHLTPGRTQINVLNYYEIDKL